MVDVFYLMELRKIRNEEIFMKSPVEEERHNWQAAIRNDGSTAKHTWEVKIVPQLNHQ